MAVSLELIDAFVKPIIDDATWDDPALRDKSVFMDLMCERNNEDLCGYPRCSNKIPHQKKIVTEPIFCSKACFKKFQQVFSKNKAEKRNPIGKIVEKFTDQRPPKKLTCFHSDRVEGAQVRTGDFSEILNEIEMWVGDIPGSPLQELNYKQKVVKDIVQAGLKQINITLKDVPEINFYFVNLDVRNLDKLSKAPEIFQKAFSFAMWELISGTDMTNEINHIRFDMAIYDELVQILGEMEPEDGNIYQFM
ncbi:hypothetical protein TVAG_197290 [Trichomonas vaginalis G3]|uniref:RTR1-type domain-containing protein n=1 Tax=Trichomonas vaginalis (strain ATCC PRA-98 / G3) TaxID=412133 RepID=A2EPJ9_TRIV3|nr:hypothetical protein TVAGG3_0599930 [Trichomonas vaginalis G3]EAY05428.1 hypothetical protein TVAG_197290 [Trichomonas vaginalis G3]KAI5523866.1 hypothetical protein TVAGG3_0599930 [Trichomonas vaginalis G3]|eukprot:XP_001317651.1 hypothetical protein [Trichomonas vaginalis G3]